MLLKMLVKDFCGWIMKNFPEEGHVIFSSEAHITTIKHPETEEDCILFVSDSPTDKVNWDRPLNLP